MSDLQEAVKREFTDAHMGRRLSDGKVYAEVKLKNDEPGNPILWRMIWTQQQYERAEQTGARVTYISTCANKDCVTMLIMLCVDEGKKKSNLGEAPLAIG